MVHTNVLRILHVAVVVSLLFLEPVFSLAHGRDSYTLAERGERPIEVLEELEGGTFSHVDGAIELSHRSHKLSLYPMHFTHAAATLPAPIVARVLEGFYNKLIAECQRRQRNNVQPGLFVDIEINRVQFIVISQGARLTWPFVIRFAERMQGMLTRGWLSTYDAYYATPPGDVMVYIGLRVIERGIFGTRVVLPVNGLIRNL